jgi:hypothetical protein
MRNMSPLYVALQMVTKMESIVNSQRADAKEWKGNTLSKRNSHLSHQQEKRCSYISGILKDQSWSITRDGVCRERGRVSRCQFDGSARPRITARTVQILEQLLFDVVEHPSYT